MPFTRERRLYGDAGNRCERIGVTLPCCPARPDPSACAGVIKYRYKLDPAEIAMFAVSMDVICEHKPTIRVKCKEQHAKAGHGGVVWLLSHFEHEGYPIRFFKGREFRPLEEFDAAVYQRYGVGEYCNNFVVHASATFVESVEETEKI